MTYNSYPFYSRRDKKTLVEYDFLWDVMQENVKGTNLKQKPTFPVDGKWQPLSLQELSLKAFNDNRLIQRVNKKLTVDNSGLEHNTSRDSTLTQLIPCRSYNFRSLFHVLLHMDNIVITVSAQVQQWLDALSSVAKRIQIPTGTCSDISEDTDIIDEEVFFNDIAAAEQSSDIKLYQNRVGYSKQFLLEISDICDVRGKLNIELDMLGGETVTKEDVDAVRCTLVRTCENTIQQIQDGNSIMCGKRKRDSSESSEPEERPLKLFKPKCGCVIC